jgi:hypothetical protein
MAKTPAWQRKEGQSPSGGLNEKGRPRKRSFCARMEGMKKKLTSEKTKRDPDSRINKSLRKWKC